MQNGRVFRCYFLEKDIKFYGAEWGYISCIIFFFEKMGLLYRANYLDKDLTNQLLGRYFTYYYDRYLAELGKYSKRHDEEFKTGWFMPIEEVAAHLPLAEHRVSISAAGVGRERAGHDA
jgi:hypothetical protein